ncbi:MAG: hypothetical protein Ct9H90mP20_5650 [Candidatus Neomarinimicrobiota bacterium]|nr:MAG: hypothetical protein Ct9H90mP20_5650 [Candidatus Neomarinimicrobiota bacterium]
MNPTGPLSLLSQCLMVSARPSSHGDPACLIEDKGLPLCRLVARNCDEICIGFCNPKPAIVPTPGSETNFTDTSAFGFTCFKSKINELDPRLSKYHGEEVASLNVIPGVEYLSLQ